MTRGGAEYRLADGWYASRSSSGAVTLRHGRDAITMQADTWASLVAAVSARGETHATWTAARALHTSVAHDPCDDEATLVRAAHAAVQRSLMTRG